MYTLERKQAEMINIFQTETYKTSEKKKHAIDVSARIFNNQMKLDILPLIRQVGIETFNRCNGNCSFCPANKNDDTRKPEFMDERLFDKILMELKEMNYEGQFCMSINNEPLLDERLKTFVTKLRKKFPKNHVVIYTNGTMMTKEKLFFLLENMDEICIDNYDPEYHTIPKLKTLFTNYWKKINQSKCKVTLLYQNPNSKMLNRGGQAPNNRVKEDSNIFTHPCLRVFWEFNIVPNGDVIACCHDVNSRIVLGNVYKNTISEIWYGEKYKELRKLMLTNKRPSIEMCRVCDQISTSIPYNKEKEIETFDNLIKDKIQNGSSIYIEPGYKALIAYFSRRGVGFHCNAISEKDFCLFNSYDTYKPFMDLVKENHYIIFETLPNSVLEAIALSRHHIVHTIKRNKVITKMLTYYKNRKIS